MTLQWKDLPPSLRRAALAVDKPAAAPVRKPRQKRPAELPMVCHACGLTGSYNQLEAHLHAEGHVRADCVLP